MPYYDSEAIERARQVDLLTYLQTCEPQELVHVSGNVYCTKTHDSLRISNGKWCWFSRGIGGYSALDYLIKVNGYVNGQSIKCTVTPTLGGHQKNNPKLVYAIDFDVTPHQLRHTYITNLLYAGVDPKTVQYLAGHENSKTTMDIYAKVKYNKPEELFGVVNGAFHQVPTQ